MAEIGAKGGRSRSEAKRKAARDNAAFRLGVKRFQGWASQDELRWLRFPWAMVPPQIQSLLQLRQLMQPIPGRA